MDTTQFTEYLAKLRAEGKLCARCEVKIRQPDGNLYCFDCMCDLETADMEKRRDNA